MSTQHPIQPAPIPSDLASVMQLLVVLVRKVDAIQKCLANRTKEHLSVAEVAELTTRTEYTVRRWIAEDRIRAIRIAGTGPRGKLIIPREEITKLIASGLGGAVPPMVGTVELSDADHHEAKS